MQWSCLGWLVGAGRWVRRVPGGGPGGRPQGNLGGVPARRAERR